MAKRLLVIESDKEARKSIEDRLLSKGYVVYATDDFATGAETFLKNEPDLALISINDWGEDCLSFIKVGKEAFPSTLFIIVAKSISSRDAFQAIRSGVADFLLKPITLSDISDAVAASLLAKESGLQPNQYFRYLEGEERSFTFPIAEAPLGPAVDILTENLMRTGICAQVEQRLVAMALTEALGNALYHGNLEIDPRLKIELGEEAFNEEVTKRLADDRYIGRKILVRYKLTPDEARYIIRDDGDGFDYTEPGNGASDDWSKEDGRGLNLIRAIMDEVTHNRRGNEVTLVKKKFPEKNHPARKSVFALLPAPCWSP